MRMFLRVFFFVVVPMLLITCDDDEAQPDNFPQAGTLDVTGITSEGATFNGTLTTVKNFTIEDHGFVWGDVNNLTTTSAQRISLGPNPPAGAFSARVTTDLETNKRYYVRSYVMSVSNAERRIVYGESMSFVSLGSAAPVVRTFEPQHSDTGDTLTIRGRNFSTTPSRNVVRIGTTPAWVIFAADTLLRVLVPDSLKAQSGAVSVSIAGNMGASAMAYTLNPPVIESFSPHEGHIGSWMTVTGKNFIRNATKLYLGSVDIGIQNLYPPTYLYTTIPTTAPGGTSTVKIKVFDQEGVAATPFKNYSPGFTDFSPREGTFGDVITLKGSGFSADMGSNSVYFQDYINATILSATETELKIKVPDVLAYPESQIVIYTHGYPVYSVEKFKLTPLQAYAFSPASGAVGDVIEITGAFFSPSQQGNQVYFNDIQANVISATRTTLTVEVPAAAAVSQLRVVTAGNTVILPGTFTLQPPVITGFSPKRGTTGTLVTLTGNYFSPHAYSNGVYLGPYHCAVESATATELKVRIQGDVTSYDPANFSVTIGEQTTTSADAFTFVWIRKADTPAGLTNALGFTYDDHAYIGLGFQYNGSFSRDIMAYNSASDTWTTKTTLTGSGRSGATCFVIGDQLFAGLGSDNNSILADFWKFDFGDNSWTRVADFTGGARTNAVSFALNGKGYTGIGYLNGYTLTKDFWEYDPAGNTWQALPDFPGGVRAGAVVLQLNDQVVVGLGGNNSGYQRDLWKFNTTDKTWTRLKDFPGTARSNSSTFTIGDQAYLACGYTTTQGYTNELWAYDFTSDTWTLKTNFGGDARTAAIGVTHNGKGYVGLGYSHYYASDIWEYNPALDQD